MKAPVTIHDYAFIEPTNISPGKNINGNSWLQCDKGWFGVKPNDFKMAYEIYGSISKDRRVKLIEMMAWAEENGINYELSTAQYPEFSYSGGLVCHI